MIKLSQDLAIKVRGALYESEMTQKELAKMLKISEVYLSQIINGQKSGDKPKEHIEKIKKLLNIK